jgi:hypothetical protein
MPQPVIPLPRYTWGDVETVFDDLALTRAQKDAVEYLLDETRRHSRNLSPLDREELLQSLSRTYRDLLLS